MVAFLLLVVGGLNWLGHAFGFNVVNMILGGVPMVEKVVYILVGLSAIYELVSHKGHCTDCGASKAATAAPAADAGGGGM